MVGLSIYPAINYDCGPFFKSLFGWEDQDNNSTTNTATTDKYFGYPFTISALNYYAIRIKIGLLFVDEFHPRGAIYLRRGSSTSSPVWTWNYDTKNAYGEQRCGSNKMDYVLYVTAEIPTQNTTSEYLYITSNENLVEAGLGYQLHWGLEGIAITVLKCHSKCSRCTGPSENDCLSCSTTGYIAINKTCVCDISLNYYKQNATGLCDVGCPAGAGWFRDNATRSCVKPIAINCTAPNRFGNSMATTGYGTCVSACPAGYYASTKIMKCTTDCWADGPNQYKFSSGAERTC